ncbi:hypothetical protein BGZ99_005769 [Dissophora globulifera]|uniref:Amino acid transporter transmembrane domain-containing protein n=1 Tax=Dissophora globulifera TaxID=979702 RepID=A0A9P6RX88_9FUNG|nr:hypothetical protein BGZ99_005769 [Dissophora globulifera]
MCTTTIIVSIAICAQLFDNLLIQLFHRTCGIQVYPHAAFICATEQLPTASPFAGVHGLEPSRVPPIGSDMSQTFGSILFNYAFVTAVPSLANAKKKNVSLQKTVGSSITIMTCIFLVVSIIGGMAYDIPENSTLIQAINASPDVTTLSKVAGYTFPIAALVPTITVNIIVLRYNLIQSGSCKKRWANVFAGVLPWLVAFSCMTGSGLTTAVGWCSLFFVSAANFVIPFILYIYSKKYKQKRLAEVAKELQQERLDTFLMTLVQSNESSLQPQSPMQIASWRRSVIWISTKAPASTLLENARPMGFADSTLNEQVEKTEDADDGAEIEDGLKEEQKTFGSDRSHDQEKTVQAPSDGEAAIPESGLKNRSNFSHTKVVIPPFASSNTYAVSGFGMCLSKHRSTSPRVASELDLQRSIFSDVIYADNACRDQVVSEMEDGLRLVEDGDQLSRHYSELDTLLRLKAVPRWVPGSGITIAWGALVLMLTGICATIM